MKQFFSTLIAVLVAFIAFGQTSPPNKLRSNDSFTQVDNYLVAAKRLGIPSGPTPTLDASTSSQNSTKLFYDTDDEALMVYDPVSSTWSAVSVDLSEYWTRTQVDSAISSEIANIPIPNLNQVTASGANSPRDITITGQSGGVPSGLTGLWIRRPVANTGVISRIQNGTITGEISFGSSTNSYSTHFVGGGTGISVAEATQLTLQAGGARISRGGFLDNLKPLTLGVATNSDQAVTLGQLNDSLSSISPSVPTLQSVTDAGNTTTNSIQTSAAVEANVFNGQNATLSGNLQTNTASLSGLLSGTTGSFSGLISAPTAPTANGHLTNKQYVDELLDSKLDTSAHGFGLGWDPVNNRMEWGSSSEPSPGIILREADLPDNELFSLGTPYLEAGPKIYVSKLNGALQETAIIAGPLGTGALIGASENPNTNEIRAVFQVNNQGLYISNGGPVNYTTDRSSVYTNRSVVDKGYVDGLVNSLDIVWERSGTGYKLLDLPATNITFGQQAVLIGSNTTKTATLGLGSLSMGTNTVARSVRSVAIGSETDVTGAYSVSLGYSNTLNAGGSGEAVIVGARNSLTHATANLVGNSLISTAIGQLTVGRFNSETELDAPSASFVVGGGVGGGSRTNLMTLRQGTGNMMVKGDIESDKTEGALILKSPDGTRWKITVDNSGNLTTTSL